jgi:hypothetical protein
MRTSSICIAEHHNLYSVLGADVSAGDWTKVSGTRSSSSLRDTPNTTANSGLKWPPLVGWADDEPRILEYGVARRARIQVQLAKRDCPPIRSCTCTHIRVGKWIISQSVVCMCIPTQYHASHVLVSASSCPVCLGIIDAAMPNSINSRYVGQIIIVSFINSYTYTTRPSSSPSICHSVSVEAAKAM